MMTSDFVITAGPASATVPYAHLLVEAVELRGGAIFRAAYVPTPYADAGREVNIHPMDAPVFEALFVAARRQTQGPDYHDVRHGWRDAKPASKPNKPGAPVRYRPGRHQ